MTDEEPRGELWDAPLGEVPLLWLDLEMTGTDPDTDHICEVAGLRVEGGVETARWVGLVKPPCPVGDSERIHQISDEALEGAPPLSAVREPLAALFSGAIVVGHTIGFDLKFLAAAAARGWIDPPPAHALDTRLLARRAWHRPSYGLRALTSELSLPQPTHRAEPDAVAAGKLLEVVAAELKAKTPRQLWQAQRRGDPIRFREDVEAVLRRAREERRAVRVAYRVPGRDPFVDVLEPWAIEGPRVEGRLHARDVRKILRGDRLLWAEPTEHAFSIPEGFETSCPSA